MAEDPARAGDNDNTVRHLQCPAELERAAMTDAREITAPLLDLIRNELASGRTNIAQLSRTSGVSRGTIYATLAAPGAGGSFAVLIRLADAIGAKVRLVVKPGVGPAHAKRRRRTNAQSTQIASAAPIELDQ